MTATSTPEATTEQSAARMVAVSTAIPRWALELVEKDAIPHEGRISIVLRKILMAHYGPLKPKDDAS